MTNVVVDKRKKKDDVIVGKRFGLPVASKAYNEKDHNSIFDDTNMLWRCVLIVI